MKHINLKELDKLDYYFIHKAIILCSFMLCIFIFIGCSGTIYKNVYIPTKCSIDIPKKPNKTPDIVENVANILKYTESLEYALKFCTDK